MSRYMVAMANLIFLGLAVAAMGLGPGWRSPPKTRSESLGTFWSYSRSSSFVRHSIAKTMGLMPYITPQNPGIMLRA